MLTTLYFQGVTMNKKTTFLSALVLSVSLCQATLASPDQTQQPFVDRFEQVSQKLDLNADQKAKIKTIREQAKKDLRPKFIEVRKIHHQLNDLSVSNTIDESKLDSLVNQEKELLGSIVKARVMERRDIFNVLTPEQKIRFSSMVKDWEKNRRQSKHRA